MSSTFAAKAASFERLKVRTRCGCRRWASQIRYTDRSEMPTCSATARPAQCVTSPGGSEQEALDALVGKALLPAPDRGAAGSGPPRHLQNGQALGREQHDPGALDVLERTRPVTDDARQPRLRGFVEENTDSLSDPLRLAYFTDLVNPPYASVHLLRKSSLGSRGAIGSCAEIRHTRATWISPVYLRSGFRCSLGRKWPAPIWWAKFNLVHRRSWS